MSIPHTYNGNTLSPTVLSKVQDPLRKQCEAKQAQLMEEMCIVVDKNDRPLSAKSKKDCHLLKNIEKGWIHRAFSVLLFNINDTLLVTQRSTSKITFPGYWTNACCSHPLYNPEELDERAAMGVKRAAQRRLQVELGIDAVSLDDIQYMTRMRYKAPSDGMWGEAEVDYLLIVQQSVELKPDPNEIQDYRYVTRNGLHALLEDRSILVSPWFKLITHTFLYPWWNQLNNLDPYKDHTTIHTGG